ncbi:hypothetical protein HAX54_014475 [Datura stramonium]|uniref:Uncharacterized protein n=1 Tax=Datura stramonium TaxID=4076 RepID=A0ABS8RIQ7_DATST|nr:hypothetical protein [Datura stramonium]
MKWVARPPKGRNQQQNQTQATNIIQDIMQNYKTVIVDHGITDGSKKLELLDENVMERELCSSEGMVNANSASNIALSNNLSGANYLKEGIIGLLGSSADGKYALDNQPKLDSDYASKMQSETPSLLDNPSPSISRTPPKNVHNKF